MSTLILYVLAYVGIFIFHVLLALFFILLKKIGKGDFHLTLDYFYVDLYYMLRYNDYDIAYFVLEEQNNLNNVDIGEQVPIYGMEF